MRNLLIASVSQLLMVILLRIIHLMDAKNTKQAKESHIKGTNHMNDTQQQLVERAENMRLSLLRYADINLDSGLDIFDAMKAALHSSPSGDIREMDRLILGRRFLQPFAGLIRDLLAAIQPSVSVNEQMLDALKGLLEDTQHRRHDCLDPLCPVDRARQAITNATSAKPDPTDKEIEAVARAIHQADDIMPARYEWETIINDNEHKHYRRDLISKAEAAIAALDAVRKQIKEGE
jgi:hypothetical protein